MWNIEISAIYTDELTILLKKKNDELIPLKIELLKKRNIVFNKENMILKGKTEVLDKKCVVHNRENEVKSIHFFTIITLLISFFFM